MSARNDWSSSPSSSSAPEEAAIAEQVRLTRLILEPRGSASPEDISEAIQTIGIPEDLREWKILNGDFRVEELGGSRRLKIGTGDQRSLSIPGSFDPRAFQRVRVYVTGDGTRVQCAFGRGGKVAAKAGARSLGVGRVEDWVDFDFPKRPNPGQSYDELLLGFQGRSACVVTGVELRHEPSWSPMPSPFEPPQLVSIEGERRSAWALTTDLPMRTIFDVPVRGRLGFSLAWPAELRAARPKLELVVTVDPGPDERIERIILNELVAEDWNWRTLDLAHLEAGTDVEVAFELESEEAEFGVCALGVPQLYSVPTSNEPSPPTVLVITSDTHRGTYLGVANSGIEIETPNLDALAARGLYFPDCRSSTNVTLPSHAALFTGMPARDVGVYSNHSALSQAALTLAETFAAEGYATFASTSNVSLLTWNGLNQGFDRAVCAPTPGGVPDAEQSLDALIEWLPEVQDRPLFIWLHLFDAHHPYDPPASHDGYYYPEQNDPFDPAAGPLDLPAGLLPGDMAGLKDLSYPEAQYRAEITYLDEQLARAFEVPRIREGIVAFTADHGELFGEGNVWFNHAGLYPGNMHVPLILVHPGVEPARLGDRIVRQVDVGRTLLDLAGLEQASFPGNNLLETSSALDEPQFAISANALTASVTRGSSHLILALRRDRLTAIDTWQPHEFRLFDLEADPRCMTNLAEREPALTAELHRTLEVWLHQVRTESWSEVVELNAAAIEHLAKLGYMDPGTEDDFRVRELFPPTCACEWCSTLEKPQ